MTAVPTEAKKSVKIIKALENNDEVENELQLAFRRPQRENRKRPTLFAFNTCH